MVVKKVKIRNEAGIHCRPSSLIMQKVQKHQDCSFKLVTSKGDTDLTSILSLMSLALEQGEEVEIHVEGCNEDMVCNELAELFAYEFDFPPK